MKQLMTFNLHTIVNVNDEINNADYNYYYNRLLLFQTIFNLSVKSIFDYCVIANVLRYILTINNIPYEFVINHFHQLTYIYI